MSRFGTSASVLRRRIARPRGSARSGEHRRLDSGRTRNESRSWHVPLETRPPAATAARPEGHRDPVGASSRPCRSQDPPSRPAVGGSSSKRPLSRPTPRRCGGFLTPFPAPAVRVVTEHGGGNGEHGIRRYVGTNSQEAMPCSGACRTSRSPPARNAIAAAVSRMSAPRARSAAADSAPRVDTQPLRSTEIRPSVAATKEGCRREIDGSRWPGPTVPRQGARPGANATGSRRWPASARCSHASGAARSPWFRHSHTARPAAPRT